MYCITTPNGSCQHPQRQAIPLLCLGHDLSAENGLGSHLRTLGQALAKLGWQIDLIGQYPGPQLQVDWLAPHCRVIRLAISPDQASSIPDLYEAFRSFEKTQGSAYPLLHSLDSLSAQVGATWKQQSLGCWLHTDWQAHPATAPTPFLSGSDQRLTFVAAAMADTTTPLDQATARRHLGIAPETAVLLCNSDLATQEAQDILWAALTHYHEGQRAAGSPDWRCLLLGDPTTPRHPGQLKLKPLHLSRRISVVPPCQAHLAYGAADVCWLPDPDDPFGTLALKALDHGLPVIAANTGGYRFTIVPGETGWLVSPGNGAAMAQASMALLSQPWRSGPRRALPPMARLSEQWQWYRAAAHISTYYRQHLACLVGATDLMIPHQVSLLLPDAVWADWDLAAVAGTRAPEQSQKVIASVLSRYGWSA